MIGEANRIVIEIGATAVTIVATGRTPASVTIECALSPTADGYAAALKTVLANGASALEAKTDGPLKEASATVALLPPLVDARLVTLPPLRAAEAAAVLQRDAARYFIGGNGARAVAVQVPRRSPKAKEPGPVFAAAAPAALVDAIHQAIAALGWRVQTIAPAHAVWTAAVLAQFPDADRIAVAAALGETVHVLRIEGGDVVSIRRVPADNSDDIIDALQPAPAALAVLASAELANALDGHATFVECRLVSFDTTAEALAFTPRKPTLAFATPAMAATRVEQRRRLSGRLALAAAVLVLLSGAVHVWGVKREIRAIEARRMDLRDEVAPLLVWRDSLLRIEERLSRLEQVDRKPGRLTAALFDIAVLLPTDAHLTAFRSKGDTIVISGLSPRAADAIQALRSARSFRNVVLDGAIDRELDAGTTTQERFTVEALLGPGDMTAAPRNQKPAIAARRSGS